MLEARVAPGGLGRQAGLNDLADRRASASAATSRSPKNSIDDVAVELVDRRAVFEGDRRHLPQVLIQEARQLLGLQQVRGLREPGDVGAEDRQRLAEADDADSPRRRARGPTREQLADAGRGSVVGRRIPDELRRNVLDPVLDRSARSARGGGRCPDRSPRPAAHRRNFASRRRCPHRTRGSIRRHTRSSRPSRRPRRIAGPHRRAGVATSAAQRRERGRPRARNTPATPAAPRSRPAPTPRRPPAQPSGRSASDAPAQASSAPVRHGRTCSRGKAPRRTRRPESTACM